jgi:hypothetical protein
MKAIKNTAKEVAAVTKALNELITCLSAPTEGSSPAASVAGTGIENNEFPAIFVAFDEAHTLTEHKTSDNQTPFIELRSALKDVDDAGESNSFFSFFLSTTSSISKFAMPKDMDNSARMIEDSTLAPSLPFSDLGFDHHMHERKIFDKFKTIEDVTSVECVIHMGRPLLDVCRFFFGTS